MLSTKAYAAKEAKALLEPFMIERREPGPHDVLIEILYSGICHSDIHQARNEWGGASFPMVPGHEISGKVIRIGAQVKKINMGDRVGVGCFVDSCRTCADCKDGVEQFCEKGPSWTYNSTQQDKKTPTFGGYSTHITVDENYVLRIPSEISSAQAAPLLCAGITTYSPLRQFKVSAGQKVGVVGMGGLGHMGVKLAVAMGAEVTVFSASKSKESDAKKFGAKHFILTADPKNLEPLAGKFDFILDTVSAAHDLNVYLGLLRRDGAMTIVGVPDKPAEVQAFSLILRRRKLSGSLIGGIQETQEMLDFCAQKKVFPEIEIIPVQKVNEAFDRTVKGDVRYRFVLDMSSL